MRLKADFLSDPALRDVLAALESNGHRALIVGGAVRNLILQMPVDDVDIATDAYPQRVAELAEAAGLKSVPTGIEHGTVTIIARGTPFEVTTFRRDVETDGRRATVSYSDRIEDDAARRDFTMNALYLTPAGELLDPVGGWEDLQRRELRFVGDPGTRIREDYLRILRFFRFLAWYADRIAPGTLQVIAAERAGLARVSAERIGAEMRKLLAAPDPAPALAMMAEAGILELSLPGADSSAMAQLVAAERRYGVAPDWPRRLAALGGHEPTDRLRLSRAETGYLLTFDSAKGLTPEEVAYHHGTELARDIALIGLATGQSVAKDWAEKAEIAAGSPLPISAADLMPALEGSAIGRGLKAAETMWIGSGFKTSRAALIDAAMAAGNEDA